MIRLEQVAKSYRTNSGHRKIVLDEVSIDFPSNKNIGVLGLNGAGKSTLIRLLSGAELPDRGRIYRDGMVSFPLGFASIFHPDLSGRENINFVARIYQINFAELIHYIEWFSELGSYLDMPVKFYSSGMLAKLAFGLCLSVDFDTYLIDEITEVGDGLFRQKASNEFRRRAKHSNVIIVSHNVDTIREYCDTCAILHNGRLLMYDTVSDGLSAFRSVIAENS